MSSCTHNPTITCVLFACCSRDFQCFPCTYLSSVVLYVLESTFSRGFESYLRSHSFKKLGALDSGLAILGHSGQYFAPLARASTADLCDNGRLTEASYFLMPPIISSAWELAFN